MKSFVSKNRWVGLVVALVLVFSISAGAVMAQTGVGFEDWGWFGRLMIKLDTSRNAGLTVIQEGSGPAVHVVDSDGAANIQMFPTGGITTAANIEMVDAQVSGDITVGDDLTIVGDLFVGDGTPDASAGILAGDEDLYVEGGMEVDGQIRADGGVDLNGADLVIDADGDSLLQEASDDNITMVLGAAAGTFSVRLGNLSVGNGTPDQALDGENAYVEGTLEVDGTAYLDGTLTTSGDIDLNGSDLIIDADGDSILQEDADDQVSMTLGAAAGYFSTLTGNFKVGNGVPTVTQDGEDAYVEGTLEVDAIAYFDGGVDMVGSLLDLDADNDTSITADTDDQIDIEISAADDFQFTANMFEVLVGSDMKMNGGVFDLDADDDTSITASTDDQIDFEISAADDFQMTANTFTILAGSKLIPENATNTGSTFVAYGSISHADIEVATTMFVIPANANIVDVSFSVDTQWNDGASAVMDCGISGGDVDAFVDNHNINDGADYNRLGDAADMPFATALLDVGGSDITVICQVDEGNVDANAGAARIYITYLIWD